MSISGAQQPDLGRPCAGPFLLHRRGAFFEPSATVLAASGWKAFRQLAFDLDISVQDLGVEAFNDVMAKHGRKQKIESAWD